jgi:hypothetical protein
MTQDEFSAAFRGSPVKRAKLRGLKRNAAVVLGNGGSADDVPALVAALSDDEPLVRSHAAWALGRVGGAGRGRPPGPPGPGGRSRRAGRVQGGASCPGGAGGHALSEWAAGVEALRRFGRHPQSDDGGLVIRPLWQPGGVPQRWGPGPAQPDEQGVGEPRRNAFQPSASNARAVPTVCAHAW